MPTGYTAAIENGISFEQYAWSCARAFGALITMRDDPHDAPIPERFEPSDYSRRSLAAAEAELAALANITPEEAQRRAEKERAEKILSNEDYIRKADALREKYDAMLAQVRAWQPPTPEHVEYKRFMEEQIVRSIDFDCGAKWSHDELAKLRAADAPDGKEWLERTRKNLIERIGRCAKDWAEEQARTESRNQWVAALRDSLRPVAA